MQVIREIREVNAATITVKIPEAFREKKLEIIVQPYFDDKPDARQADKLVQFDQMVENARKRNIKIDEGIAVDALMNEMNNGLC